MSWKAALETYDELQSEHTVPGHFTSGFAIGIIAVHLIYPKVPGNVANASTYPFPVLYKEVDFPIERLFEGDDSIETEIITAARELEAAGVRAIIGACGYFAHFQEKVADAVNVPVFLSSLCQLPMIKTGLSSKKKIAVLAASGDNINDDLLNKVGTDTERLLVKDIGSLESFAPIRWGKTTLDNGELTEALVQVVVDLQREHPNVGAILLECSDLPPYAKAIQGATGLPVFDFNTMIDLVYHSVVQKTYYGIF
ncbi:MAG: aspartate/glutamate racemase family protein [Lachnospiraceae bacterium]|nr:aspartate/glutamate racemase family protein [Lachnospiraceae bacterium]